MFKSGDIVVKKDDRGIPGLTLREYSVVGEPYTKYRQMMFNLVGGTGSRTYSTMYPVDQFELLSDHLERI